jgi:hypothetical protein
MVTLKTILVYSPTEMKNIDFGLYLGYNEFMFLYSCQGLGLEVLDGVFLVP